MNFFIKSSPFLCIKTGQLLYAVDKFTMFLLSKTFSGHNTREEIMVSISNLFFY